MLEAMTILGYGTMYNSREALRRQHLGYFGEFITAKYGAGGERWPPPIEHFESFWGEYRTISGDVVYPFAEECIQLYPDAKIILTVRDDEEVWLRSLEETMWYNRNRWLTQILPYFDPAYRKMADFTIPYWKYLFGNDVPSQGIRWYRQHNAMVQRLAGDRCLVFNTKQGWEPLCQFLGKEVPNVPFPHVNKTDEHRYLFKTARKNVVKKLLKQAVARGGMAAILIAVIWWKRSRIGDLLKRTSGR